MLTLRYLLSLIAAVLATAIVSLMAAYALQHADPLIKSVATSLASGKSAKSEIPISLRKYKVDYTYSEGRWVLTNRGGIPLYAVGVGVCPDSINVFFNKTYSSTNNTVHISRCSIILPSIEMIHNSVVFTHVVPLCLTGTDFKTEVVEQKYIYANFTIRVRAVVVNC